MLSAIPTDEKSNLTPNGCINTEGYLCRNHCALPEKKKHLDPRTHRVCVNGCVRHPLNLSIANSGSDFPQHKVVCALQCAGNRRHDMRTLVKGVQRIDCIDNDAHVTFASFQVECQDDSWYGASIPLSRALDSDKEVVLALERNGKPLSIRHGYPMWMITPGLAGARAVKWLDRITSQNHYMRRDYKALPPHATDSALAEIYWNVTSAVQDMPIDSVIVSPRTGDKMKRDNNGCVECFGYALPSGESGLVVKVDVSTDEGYTWTEAKLEHHDGGGKWTWKFGRVEIAILRGESMVILSKATDASSRTQPSLPPWNLYRVCYNGYGEARDLTIR
ncbi:molybdopterin binding oxidoreductase [Daldinia bambusicola]|nr:molybdopterin binding oxidoreductase [Daldinia bambusicola]